jgi:hypothetical protein
MEQLVVTPEVAVSRGVPVWTGVVMIERPDPTKTMHVPFSDGPPCHVRSARTIDLGGRRAIVCHLPYAAVAEYFPAGAGDSAFAWAELHGAFLQLMEPASMKEWVDFSGPNSHG